MLKWLLILLLLCGCDGTPTLPPAVTPTPVPTWTLPPPPVVDPSPTQPPSPTASQEGLPTPYWTIPPTPKTRTPLAQNTPQVQATRIAVITSETMPVLVGLATYYGGPYIGRKMKNGQVYDPNALTCAASSALWDKFGSKTIRVCLLDGNRCVEVRVTDCGDAKAFAKYGVVVDLSPAAFLALGLDLAQGVANVTVRIAEEE